MHVQHVLKMSRGLYTGENFKQNILTGFKNATLTPCYILQKTFECKLSLLRLCHHEVDSSVDT